MIEHAWVEDTLEHLVYDVGVAKYEVDYWNQFVIKWRAHYQDRNLVLRLHNETGTWGPVQWMKAMGINPSERMGD